MSELKALKGVDSIVVNKEEAELHVNSEGSSTIILDLDVHGLMHLLAEFTDEEINVHEDIYGVKKEL